MIVTDVQLVNNAGRGKAGNLLQTKFTTEVWWNIRLETAAVILQSNLFKIG